MPQATALNFYRKRQTFELLSQERPQNLSSVYHVVREVVASIEERLVNLETSFYGPGGGPDTEVKQWIVPLQLILRPARYSGLICMQQLDEIYDRHIDITDILTVDEDSLIQIQNLVNKSLKMLREGFDESIQSVQKLLEYMARYCVSFSPPEGDSYLETATNYEKQRRDFEKAIRLNTENITLMADKFENESLKVHQFDFTMKEMAEKMRIDQSPIAIVFPAACHNLRNACQGLLMWVNADCAYAEYLRYDIQELERKKEAQAKVYRDAQLKANNGEFTVKSLRKYIGECNDQLKRLKPREQNLKAEGRRLRAENKDVLVDLDIKEYRKMEMRLTGSITDREGQERYERLHSEILDLQSRKPAIERRITDLERQQTWISGRQMHRHSKEEELEQASLDLRNCRRKARKSEVELERIQGCLAKLKEIHLLKTSQETLKKIFHNMPINSRYAQPLKKKKDNLEKFCKFVASEIEGDWIRLYRALPFYPARGMETVSADIDDIITRFLRNSEEQAHQGLSRWRRMHTRAGVNDLRQALHTIKRKDIVEKYDKMLTPRSKMLVSPKAHRMVHFPKISPRSKKKHKNHYLSF
ncbi:uncharacterized protein LOC101863343 [Aplysia californica]|uniref:Uncharacterized protein LOC101863343 n=1 Tax=Aplysia californica TaxID=6500 RepID=A0ABM0JP56_APLCA|nr:uncharacterized protein LOC101863343 [Aplysia californica]XP_005098262.1 uncharacterized protein LOC101863343 [Aplysia californica]